MNFPGNPTGAFDDAARMLAQSPRSMTERELLDGTVWRLGEDARLREDYRFRPTPWGRWMLSVDYLANDALVGELREIHPGGLKPDDALSALGKAAGRRAVVCPGDPRIVMEGDGIRLAATELGNQPLIEADVDELAQFTTHLPLYDIRAAAACDPKIAGTGSGGTPEVLGWLAVNLPVTRRLNRKMFVSRVVGHSMDGGKTPIRDGDFCVFEFGPVGTKAHHPYLIRGVFADPETGDFAVKVVRADTRDKAGRHRMLELVSWNPDQQRYAPLPVDVTHEENLTFVAEHVTVLKPGDYVRKPRDKHRRGRRDVSSKTAQATIGQRLRSHAERFFAETPPPSAAGKPDTETWGMRLVCLDAESGGPSLEIGPLAGLWSFIKKLRVEGTGWTRQLLASNARLRPVQIDVPPGSGPWKVDAVGFEDDPDIDLTMLSATVPNGGPATVFRVDAAGVGRLVSGASVAPGQLYRLLISQKTWRTLKTDIQACELPGGWRLVELPLALEPVPAIRILLDALGIALGTSQPGIVPVGAPPVEWRNNARGDLYPCYLAGDSAFLRVTGLADDDLAGASVFVQGHGTLYSLPELDSAGIVEVCEADEGQYVCGLLHERTAIPPAYLPFAVIDQLPAPPSAHCAVLVNNDEFSAVPGERIETHPVDLRTVVSDELMIAAPPGWPVQIIWHDVRGTVLGCLHADSGGHVDCQAFLGLVGDRPVRGLLADVILDFSELGVVVLCHEQERSPESVRSAVQTLIDSRGSAVAGLAGDYGRMMPIWIRPACMILGYEDVSELTDVPAPPRHAAAYALIRFRRTREGIEQRPCRLLIMLEELGADMDGDLTGWADQVCRRERIDAMIFCDGARWAARRRGSQIALHVRDVRELAADVEWDDFLREFGEGI